MMIIQFFFVTLKNHVTRTLLIYLINVITRLYIIHHKSSIANVLPSSEIQKYHLFHLYR